MANREARITNFGAARMALVAAVFGVPFVVLGAGCRTTQPVATTQPAVPADGNAALMAYIGEQPFVTAGTAYPAVYILWKGEVFDGGFEALSAALRDGKVIGGSWKHASSDFLDRQMIGYMVCRACDIRSGLNWQLTGLGRYAWRELQYKQIAGPGGEWSLMSGGAFQGLLARADEYLYRTRKTTTERAELGEEP